MNTADYLPIEPMQEDKDCRRNLPSASGMERIALCPGSWNLEQQCPHPEPSEDAVSGILIHAALETGDTSKLTEEQAQTVMMALKIEAELLQKTFPGEGDIQTVTEKRLWVDGIYSGKADQIHLQGEKACIIDFKSGRAETERAEGNAQLRALAALAWKNLGVTSVTVAIIQPWVSPQVSVCTYSETDLRRAHMEILSALLKSNDPNAPRIPGERQCKYCRALSVCPEAKAVVNALIKYPPVGPPAIMDPEARANFLQTCAMAERVIDSYRTWAKALLEVDADSIPGWRLKPGAVKSTITDVPLVYQRMKVWDITPEEFAHIVKVTKKDLLVLLRQLSGRKGKELDQEMDQILQGCTEEKQNAPSLERVNTQ